MQVPPMKNLAEANVDGLGFQMTQKTKKDCRILLSKKDNWQDRLILAHYCMSLMPGFLFEGCLSIYLKSKVFDSSNGDYNGEPLEVSEVVPILSLYAKLFENEHFVGD